MAGHCLPALGRRRQQDMSEMWAGGAGCAGCHPAGSIWPAEVLLSLNHDAGYSEDAALPPQNPFNPTTAPRGAVADLLKQQTAFLISIKKPKAGTDYVKFNRAGVAIGRFLDHY